MPPDPDAPPNRSDPDAPPMPPTDPDAPDPDAPKCSLHRPDALDAEVVELQHARDRAVIALEVLVGEPLVECPGPLAGGLEVVPVDHGGIEVVPLVGAPPGLPADEGVAGHEHDRRVQRGALQQAGEEHGAVDAVGRAVPERLAR